MRELENALVALGRQLEIPMSPDLVSSVRPQLAPRRRRLLSRPVALAVAFAVLAVLAATLAIPDARSALFRVLHIGSAEIQFVDELPAVEPGYRVDYTLGREISLATARRQSHFRLRTLDEKPDHVYRDSNGTVWFLYGTPEHVRLLVAQTPDLRVDGPLIFKKIVPGGTHVEGVSVDGVQGYFLSGEPHELLLLNRKGEVVSDSPRLAHDVLVWSRGGVTNRLEGDLSKAEALRFARSLH